MTELAIGVDLFAMAFVFGATVWFFFVQAPLLLAKLGREKFVPIQMMLTRVLGKALLAGTLLVVVAALVAERSLTAIPVLTAGLGLLGALVNERILIPRALRAGGRGQRTVRGKDDEASTAGFASKGVGSSTALLHRLVVVFVVVMLTGLVGNGISIVGIVGG